MSVWTLIANYCRVRGISVMSRANCTVDMALLVFSSIALILSTQPVISLAKDTVEDVVTDPFDMGRYSQGGKIMKMENSAYQETIEWVDPFDMTRYKHGEKKMLNEFHSNEMCESCQCKRNGMEKNFLQRLVNLLVNQCKNDGIIEGTSIILKVTSNQLQELYQLKDATDTEATIRVLNGIFSYMTTYDKPNFIMEFFISEEIWSNIATMSFALLPLCIFIMGGTMRRVVCILSLAVFAVGFYKTQKLMLKKVEMQNEHTLMKQTDCIPRGWSWFNIFRSDNEAECLKQLHAMKVDPSLEVTPIQVISHMVAVGCFQPLEQFGIMFSRFSNQILGSHSVLYGLFVFPIAVLMVIYIISACCAGIFGRNFSVGNRYISLGMTGSTLPDTERRHALLEPAPESQVDTKPKTEMSTIKYEHFPQPVIQIIHNYPIKDADVPVVQNDVQIKHVPSEKDTSNNGEMKSVDSLEESHKIHEITPGSSGPKQDMTETNECGDCQNN